MKNHFILCQKEPCGGKSPTGVKEEAHNAVPSKFNKRAKTCAVEMGRNFATKIVARSAIRERIIRIQPLG